MKYKFLKENYTIREEENDTVSLMINKTNQIIYLNSAAKKLLNDSSSTGELSAFVENLDTEEKAQAYKDYEELLYQLECFDVVKLEKQKSGMEDSCRIAGEKDYNMISQFIRTGANNPLSYTSIANKKYYDSTGIRARQFNNMEYNLLYFMDGKLEAVLVVSLPPSASGLAVSYLSAVFFGKQLSEAQCEEASGKLITFALGLFEIRFSKIRFHYYDKTQDKLLEILKKQGFTPICTFKDELRGNKPLTVYDIFFEDSSVG